MPDTSRDGYFCNVPVPSKLRTSFNHFASVVSVRFCFRKGYRVFQFAAAVAGATLWSRIIDAFLEGIEDLAGESIIAEGSGTPGRTRQELDGVRFGKRFDSDAGAVLGNRPHGNDQSQPARREKCPSHVCEYDVDTSLVSCIDLDRAIAKYVPHEPTDNLELGIHVRRDRGNYFLGRSAASSANPSAAGRS